MGKRYEALERYKKEKKQFAETMGLKLARGLRLARRDARVEDSSKSALTNMDSIRNRELVRTVLPSEQISRNERNLLYWLRAEQESERNDSGRLIDQPLKTSNPGHSYKAQLKISYRTQGNPNRILVNKNPGNPTDRFELYELNNLFAKQIVSNLKSGVIQSIIKYKYFFALHHYIKYVGGELLKFENGCFYRLNFESKAMLSILLDRKGYLLNFLQHNKKHVARRIEQVVPSMNLNADGVKKLELKLVRNIFNAADLNAIIKALSAIFDITFYDEIKFSGGKIVVLNGKVAYDLLANLKLGFSIFMDKYGNFLDVSAVEELNAWEKVIRDYSIHKNWLPSINLFKSGQSKILTV